MTLGAKRAGEDPPRSRKQTVVVVDDCEVTLASTAETLERAGYRVITRDRPAGCVAMMLQEKPDLVLLDVCMPTVSGDTLVKLFSRASPNSGTIILLYSALDEPLLRSKAKASGAHGYIAKTNDSSVLLRAIRRWLRPSQIDLRVSLPGDAISAKKALSAVAQPAATTTATKVSLRPSPSHTSSALRRAVEQPRSSRMLDLDLRTSGSMGMKRTSGSYQIGAPTVLFVDDDMLVLSGYRRQLFGQPYEFDFALSGAQALRLVQSASPPSVIVSDLLMPEPNGRELLRRALDCDASWGRRFIIVTAQSMHDARMELDPRFQGTMMRKPVQAEALSSAIRAALGGLGVPAIAESAR